MVTGFPDEVVIVKLVLMAGSEEAKVIVCPAMPEQSMTVPEAGLLDIAARSVFWPESAFEVTVIVAENANAGSNRQNIKRTCM